MVATGQGGVWESRSNLPCPLFVSAGLIDETRKLGEHSNVLPQPSMHCIVRLSHQPRFRPAARGHWRQVARFSCT